MTVSEQAIEYLRKTVNAEIPDPRLRCGIAYAWCVPDFRNAAGGSKHHHAYPGGLAVHTAEVLSLALEMATEAINREVLITACVWHDVGKTWEYSVAPDGIVSVNSYAKMVGHVAGSAFEFLKVARQYAWPEATVQAVVHCLLSHHGRREWGSPVEPATPEAFILHSADMLSVQAYKAANH